MSYSDIGSNHVTVRNPTGFAVYDAHEKPERPHDPPLLPLAEPPIFPDREIFFSVFFDEQDGQGGASVALTDTISSYSLPQSLHRYS